MSPREEDTALKASSLVGKFFSALITPLASPIRTMHLTIGHSTVSAGFLIAIAIVGNGWIQSYIYSEGNAPALAALEVLRMEEANLAKAKTRDIELKNGTTIRSTRVWSSATMKALPDSIEITIPKIGNKLLVTWKPILSDSGGGMLSFDIAEDGDVTQTFTLASELFQDSWVVGGRISFDMEQVLPDGRSVTYSLRKRIVTIVGP